jgi:hypothetical protein
MSAGAVAVHDYTNDPQWANRGYPTSNLQSLAATLGVTLPTQPITQMLIHQLELKMI